MATISSNGGESGGLGMGPDCSRPRSRTESNDGYMLQPFVEFHLLSPPPLPWRGEGSGEWFFLEWLAPHPSSLLKTACRVGPARYERRPTLFSRLVSWWARAAKRCWSHPTSLFQQAANSQLIRTLTNSTKLLTRVFTRCDATSRETNGMSTIALRFLLR